MDRSRVNLEPPDSRLPDRRETAVAHLCAEVARISENETVEKARLCLMSRRFSLIDLVIVVDLKGCYVGVVETADILSLADSVAIGQITRRDWPTVRPDLDQELALETAAAAGITTLPVVDDDGRPLGCIPPLALIEVMAAEHREDVHRMAGILRQNADGREALDGAPLLRFARRMPWLLIGLGMSSAGTAIMVGFEKMLSSNVAVAFFIPALVYLTDAIGTQTEAIAVRGLASMQRPFATVLMGEMATGALIGAALGLLAVFGIWVSFGDFRLAACVGISLCAAGTLASAIGLSLPWSLGRLGIDPALGSGPVATIMQDVLTLLVYFTVLSVLLQESVQTA